MIGSGVRDDMGGRMGGHLQRVGPRARGLGGLRGVCMRRGPRINHLIRLRAMGNPQQCFFWGWGMDPGYDPWASGERGPKTVR